MLEIKNLTIKYDRMILDDVGISFSRGTVTVISGLSGIGKSSLLNVLGLIKTPNKECSYYLDNENIDFNNEIKKADFRLRKIGFIFQQNNLIQGLNAIDNIMIPQNLISSNEMAIEEKANDLINYVGLSEVANSYPCDLSGGEEQRVAIARALMNDADIILADEPTASLDPENSRSILELFKKLAHELNKIVIIVSHDESVSEISDVLYEIKNKKLELIRKDFDQPEQINDISIIEDRKKIFRFIRNYEKKRRKEKGLGKSLIIATALIAAVSSLFINFGDSFNKQQKEFVNSISENNIFVINDVLGLDAQINYESARSFSDEEYDSIKEIRNIKNIYPFYEFKSYNYSNIKGESTVASIVFEDKSIVDKEIVYNSHNEAGFTIVPLYPEEEISNLLLNKSKDMNIREGFVLANSFAKTLSDNPLELIGKIVEIRCFVPTKLYDSEAKFSDNEIIKNDSPVFKSVVIKRKITGIMDDIYVNQRSEEAYNYIYLDYMDFINIINENKDTNYETTNQKFPEKELKPSALMIYADSYDYVPYVKSKIENLSSNYDVVSKGADLEKIEYNLTMIKNTMRVVSLLMVLVVMTMFGFVYFFKNRTRKKEVAILKALGITGNDVVLLIGYEMILISLKTFLLSIFFSLIIVLLGKVTMLDSLFIVTSFSLLFSFFLSVFIVTASGISSVWKTSRIDIIDAIRNNK
jgi:ABC-type lipoprotein export system ATPase subunit/ABC-type lipoprotein release transport system permease subunit